MASGSQTPLSPHDPQSTRGDRSRPLRPGTTREEQFLAELPLIERVVSWVCARRSLRGADADDFRQSVMLRFVDGGYDVLAKFQGKSSLKTYLTAVINRMYLDFQVQRFGKWRPSAEARRLGPAALRLECLVYRDGLSLDEACSVLLSDSRLGENSDTLHAIGQRLPARAPRGRVGAPLGEPRHDGPSSVERAERQALAYETLAVIRCAVSKLAPRDRMLVRLLFESGFTVADAARGLRLDQKALYRERDGVLERLRDELARAGIDAADVHELLANLDWDAALELGPPARVRASEETRPRPSQGHDHAAPQKGGQ